MQQLLLLFYVMLGVLPGLAARAEPDGCALPFVSGPPERFGTIIEAGLASRKKLIADAKLPLE